MTVSSTTSKVSFSGNGSTTAFAVSFYFLATSDLKVTLRKADGTEVVKTLATDYTVTGAGVTSGGTVTMGTAPASGETLVIQRNVPFTQLVDYQPNDPFPANTHEQALDKLTMEVQQLNEAVSRSIKVSTTNTITSPEFTVDATTRANKVLAFDAAGELAVTQELGTYKGNWATGTTYAARSIIKDTSNNNIYICVTAHTASGAQPISTNTDSAKWALIVDAASATSSASAASSSASAASSSATAAATSATNAATSATSASTSASTATTQASNASTSASNASTSATNAATSATAAANSATTAAAAAAAGLYRQVLDKTANYTVLAADQGTLFRMNTGSGALTVTLPQISTVTDGFKVSVVKWTGDANGVTINRSGSDTINGTTNATIGSQYTQTTFVADFETNTWLAVSSGLGSTNVLVDVFSGNGSTTAFTLSGDPGSKNNTDVYISGVHQNHATYTQSGTTITFSAAPPSGTSNIEIVWTQPLAIGVPGDGTVSTAKIADANVTLAKLDTAAYGTSGANKLLQLDSAGKLPAIDGSQITGVASKQIQPISASAASNALTISASALSLDFRSTTLGSGTITTVTGTPASLTIPSTATLGTINAIQSRLIVIAINNAGTIELAVVNSSGGNDLTETGLISTSAISAGVNQTNTIYSNSARSSVAYRVIGYIESTQATAGTWATAPSTIQGYGGQALSAMSSLGYSQTWQAPARSLSTTYYNTTGRPISWNITADGGAPNISMSINGTERAFTYISASSNPFATLIVPPGASYSGAISGGTLRNWHELR
jgi:hypothetical protein